MQVEERLAALEARGTASDFLVEPTAELATASLIQQLETVVGDASPGGIASASIRKNAP